MVGREDRGASVLEGVERVEVELGEAARRCVARLRGAHVDAGSGDAHRGRATIAGVGAAGVVSANGEGTEFVLGVDLHWDFVFFGEGDGALGADEARGDVTGVVAEDVAGDDVEDADDDCEDARGNEETPEGEAKRVLAGGFLVHVAEHVESEDGRGASKSDEAMGRTKQGPVAGEVTTEERALRDDEEH